uniref:Uncharacterized protein n=1 Tax=Phlebotomus papatasi TaxID=29031 RepID=A0A1B0DJ01_PHLPP
FVWKFVKIVKEIVWKNVSELAYRVRLCQGNVSQEGEGRYSVWNSRIPDTHLNAIASLKDTLLSISPAHCLSPRCGGPESEGEIPLMSPPSHSYKSEKDQ